MRIIIIKDPNVHADHPAFYIEACIGLQLQTQLSFGPGEDAQHPDGIHLVAYTEIVRALTKRDYRACQYFTALWGHVAAAGTTEISAVLIPVPFECCEVVH